MKQNFLFDLVFTNIPKSLCHNVVDSFPFLSLEAPRQSLGLFLPKFVFYFQVFLNPGLGIHRQTQGWSMDTNASPIWAQVMLRAYDRA